jgi:hypothetical protein
MKSLVREFLADFQQKFSEKHLFTSPYLSTCSNSRVAELKFYEILYGVVLQEFIVHVLA